MFSYQLIKCSSDEFKVLPPILPFICPTLLIVQDYISFGLEDGLSWQEYSFRGAGDVLSGAEGWGVMV